MNQDEYTRHQQRVKRELELMKNGEDEAVKKFRYYQSLSAYKNSAGINLLEFQVRKIFQEGVDLGRDIERARQEGKL